MIEAFLSGVLVGSGAIYLGYLCYLRGRRDERGEVQP